MCGGTEVEDTETAKNNSKGAEAGGEQSKYGGQRKVGTAWSNGDNGPPREYDPTFNGPIKNRGCTDIICCILFLVCIVGMAVVGYWAYANGDPKLLLYPSDSDGNLCGYGDFEDKPNLFFFDLVACAKVGPAVVTNGCPTKQVCVTSCPTTYWTWYLQFGKERGAEALGAFTDAAKTVRETGRADMICVNGVNQLDNAYSNAAGLDTLIVDDLCAGYFYPQKEVLGRCLPSFLSDGVDKLATLAAAVGSDNTSSEIRDSSNSTITLGNILDGSGFVSKLLEARDYGEKILADVENAKWFILVGLVLSMVVCFIWIVIMRWLAGIIVWTTMIAFVGIFVFTTYYSYTTYYKMKNAGNSTGEFIFTTDLTYYLNLEKTWLAFGCTSATFLTILVLVILFLRSRIMIAIALIKEGSRAIGMMMFTLLWPIWPFILQMALVAYWGATCLYLASTSKQVYRATNSSVLTANNTYGFGQASTTTAANLIEQIPCDPAANDTLGSVCSFVKNEVSAYTTYLQIYMLFMFFWVMNWIIGFGQMVLAGAFAAYYWAFDKKTHMPVFPILGSVGRTLLYHTGSIAFGALIIAIIQIIRVGLEYLDSKLSGSENRIAKFFLKCLKCCFYCLEKFMKMINKNAYILIAVYGRNFCTAAKDAFFLIMRNVVRVAVVDKVTDFILFIGKLVVVGGLVLLSYFFFNGRLGTHIEVLRQYQPELNYFFIPVIFWGVLFAVGLSYYFFAPTIAKPDFIAKYAPGELNYYFIPIIVIAVASYVIASCFFSVYGMAVDTLFICFLEDLERNDGSVEKPYYMSKELKEILGKKNVRESKED